MDEPTTATATVISLRQAAKQAKDRIAELRSEIATNDAEIATLEAEIRLLAASSDGPVEAKKTRKCRVCHEEYTGRKCPCRKAGAVLEMAGETT